MSAPLKRMGLDTIRLTLTADEDVAPAILTMSWARAGRVRLLVCVTTFSEGSVLAQRFLLLVRDTT